MKQNFLDNPALYTRASRHQRDDIQYAEAAVSITGQAHAATADHSAKSVWILLEAGMNTITEAIVYAIMWLAQIIMGDQT